MNVRVADALLRLSASRTVPSNRTFRLYLPGNNRKDVPYDSLKKLEVIGGVTYTKLYVVYRNFSCRLP